MFRRNKKSKNLTVVEAEVGNLIYIRAHARGMSFLMREWGWLYDPGWYFVKVSVLVTQGKRHGWYRDQQQHWWFTKVTLK